MFLKTVLADGQAEQAVIREMKARAAGARGDIEQTVRAIMDDVQARGWDAVCEYAEKFDGKTPYIVSPSELEAAYAACAPRLTAAREQAAVAVRRADRRPRLYGTAAHVEWRRTGDWRWRGLGLLDGLLAGPLQLRWNVIQIIDDKLSNNIENYRKRSVKLISISVSVSYYFYRNRFRIVNNRYRFRLS